MKGPPAKRLILGTCIALCVVLMLLLVFPSYVAAGIAPPLVRAKARRVLAAARTPDELHQAVGSLGRFFPLEDGSWVAVRYRDSHTAGYSCAVALDSGGGWFYSSRHFCGRFQHYDVIQKKTRELAAAMGDDEVALQAALREKDKDLYDLAAAKTLSAARSQLLNMGFSQ